MNKKVLKYILSINSFGLGGTHPPCFADKIFFERRVTDFWRSATPYWNEKCSSKAFGDQRFPMWSILVTKSLQAPMFRWPKVWRVVQVPRCPNPGPHVRPLGRLRQRHSGLKVTMVLYGIAQKCVLYSVAGKGLCSKRQLWFTLPLQPKSLHCNGILILY